MIPWLKQAIGQRSALRMSYHAAKALLAAAAYGFPARNLTVIGLTGTDGKTTTCSMIRHVLTKAHYRVGLASTAFFDDGTGLQANPSHLTSISPFVLQKLLRTMMRNGCTHAILECSSHGLVQHRLDWTFPKVAAITNTAPEHLDYHGTMELYRKDKGILFRMLHGRGTKVLNGNDETFAMYCRIASTVTLDWNSPEARENAAALSLQIPGAFNRDNALCAMSVCSALGLDVEACKKALATFPGVPGRMERIDEGQPFAVFVDFAVSPQSYEKALQTLREMVGESGNVIVLCSSCGNRMREKRPEIGRICSVLADIVIATEDETYGEDPHAVLEELWAGIDQAQCEAHNIFDRREAIIFALKSAKPGDAVVFCGMGPFTTMTKLTGRVPWDERAIVREELAAMGYASSPLP
ncbi:hypothetical protein FJZ27_00995 [Candidatus Peribacteria bacterium]|nr:hypothetical protein [Candidatus Peribacteria bacterium]